MKVYTENIHKSHSNLERLEKYFYKSQQETTIFSEDGIFKIKDGEINKINITDCIVEVKKNYNLDQSYLEIFVLYCSKNNYYSYYLYL